MASKFVDLSHLVPETQVGQKSYFSGGGKTKSASGKLKTSNSGGATGASGGCSCGCK